MTDLQDQLADVFETTAAGADVPPLALQDVLARGRRLQQVRRRRTALWTAAAAAVAVVAVTLPLALAGHGTKQAPQPAHHTQTPSVLPSGSPVTLPYLGGHQLHADGHVLATDADTILSRGGVTYVRTGDDASTWSHLVDGRLRQVSGTPTREQPWLGWHDADLSPDGRQLTVLTYPTPDTTRVIAYRTADDREIAHVDLALAFSNWTGGGYSLSILGTDVRGQVFWVQEQAEGRKLTRTDWVWRPGQGAPVQLGEPFTSQPYGVFQVPPAGPVVGGTLGTVDGDHWQPIGHVPGSGGGAWSPSGDTLARGGGSPALLTPSTGGTITPDLPAPLVRWVGFESDTDVLGVVGSRDHAQLVRCHVDDSGCELVQDLPDNWKSWEWAANGPASPTTANATGASSLDPKEPFVKGTTLYAGGRSFEVGKHVNLVTAGDTVLVGHWGRTITWQTLRGGRLMPLPYGEGRMPVLSPKGTRVAVATHPTPRTSRITVYDAMTDATIDRVDLDLPATCCDGGSIQHLSIDVSGTARWVEERANGDAPVMQWRPGSAPVRAE